MKIGIIGAGAMSDALGTKWTASGHNIFIYLLFNGYNPYTVLNLIVADEVEKN